MNLHAKKITLIILFALPAFVFAGGGGGGGGGGSDDGGGGGYTSITDMFDGGGAGGSGDTYCTCSNAEYVASGGTNYGGGGSNSSGGGSYINGVHYTQTNEGETVDIVNSHPGGGFRGSLLDTQTINGTEYAVYGSGVDGPSYIIEIVSSSDDGGGGGYQPGACYSDPNVCGTRNIGLTISGGGCDVAIPDDPENYGTPCQSGVNACGLYTTGVIGCNGCQAFTIGKPLPSATPYYRVKDTKTAYVYEAETHIASTKAQKCYAVNNQTGNDLFIPVKTIPEFESFVDSTWVIDEVTVDLLSIASGTPVAEQAFAEVSGNVSVDTLTVKQIADGSATLSGQLNIGSWNSADVYFIYGLGYENLNQTATSTTATSSGPFEITVSGLNEEASRYYFRAIAEDTGSSDVARGNIQSFVPSDTTDLNLEN